MTVEWKISNSLVLYEDAVCFMENRVNGIINGTEKELIWLLEHPPIYTSGTSAKTKDLLNKHNLPVYVSKRGGQYTFHGPGQRVVYIMLDLNKYGRDVRGFVKKLENWIIHILSKFNLKGFTRSDRIGVWVNEPNKSLGGMDKSNEYKIAAIGIRLRKWVSFHGISINVNPDLSYYEGIVPCGIKDYGITSFNNLGLTTTMEEVDNHIKTSFQKCFYNLGKSPQLEKKLE